MNLSSGNATKTFNLLSIGQRAVGKTVFLVGSYAELHADSLTENAQQLWFDCQYSYVQENIDKIFNYIVQTGKYPPPTTKVTNFNFSVKRHSLMGVHTLCHFRWGDIPGEICKKPNQYFQMMVSNAHGCCVFIDANELVHNDAYLQTLEDIIEQVMAIVSVASRKGLKYPFALVLTKCDLLETGPLSHQQIEKNLQPLTTRFDAVNANYQTFYSSIPIFRTESASTLRPKGAAAALLWLVCELNKAHNPGLINNLLELVTRSRQTGLQALLEGVDGSPQILSRPVNIGVKKIPSLYLLATVRRNILLLAVASIGLVGVIGLISNALSDRATLRQSRQLNQAIPVMEKLVQQEPKRLELRLQLAEVYEITGQVTKAEIAYDQVLAQEKNNLDALVGKAKLRKAQGDTKTAYDLFAQAEKVAPADLKAQIRTVAQKTLQPAGLLTPPAAK